MMNKFSTYGRADIFCALDVKPIPDVISDVRIVRFRLWIAAITSCPNRCFKKSLMIFPFSHIAVVFRRISISDPMIDERMPQLMAYARKKLPM